MVTINVDDSVSDQAFSRLVDRHLHVRLYEKMLTAEKVMPRKLYTQDIFEIGIWVGARVVLGQYDIDTTDEEKMLAVLSPNVMMYLFASNIYWNFSDRVDPIEFMGKKISSRRYKGFNVISPPYLPGMNTERETCFFLHSDALSYIDQEPVIFHYKGDEIVHFVPNVINKNAIVKWERGGRLPTNETKNA